MNQHWLTASASVRGASHVKTGAPCQDESSVKTSPDGKWVALVVSDGAGTASRADEGSKHVVRYFSEELLKLVKALEDQPPGNWINDFVIEKVLESRKSLRQLAQADNIRDFNCTLVACLQGPHGGFSIHIGDGSIVGGYREQSNGDEVGRLFVSKPENGEYANETFFITEKDWIRHLRITPMPKLDWVLCCTDGGGALALVNDDAPKIGFLEPVMERVFQFDDPHLRRKALADYLSDAQSNKVTGDDKTLALAIQPGNVQNLDWYKATELTNGASIPKTQVKAKSSLPLANKESPSQASAATNAGRPPGPVKSAETITLKNSVLILCSIVILSVLAFFVVEIFFSPHDKKLDSIQTAPVEKPIESEYSSETTAEKPASAPASASPPPLDASTDKPQQLPESPDQANGTQVSPLPHPGQGRR